jgi:hypothetical protein
MPQQEAVRGRIVGRVVGTVGAVNCGEERVGALRTEELLTNAADAEAKGVTGQVAGSAGTAIAAKPLKNGLLLLSLIGLLVL